MNKLIDKVQGPMMKIADKFNTITFLCVVRDAIIVCFPIIIFGSLITIIGNFPFLDMAIGKEAATWWKELLSPASNATINALSLFLCIGIGYYYASYKESDSLYCSAVCVCAFIVLAPWWSGDIVAVNANGEQTGDIVAKAVCVLTTDQLGAKGMFVAMFSSFGASALFCWLSKKNLSIKMPEQVPPGVTKSFMSLIPATICLFAIFIVRVIFTFTLWEDIFTFIYEVVQAPLIAMGSGVVPTIFAIFFVQFFWFFGLHGQNIINSCMDPIWNTLMVENYTAYSNGDVLPNIVTKPFIETFTVGLGGSGATLIIIVLIIIFAKSKQFNSISKLAFAPGIFNVNEPFIFGMPIIFNPLFIIPWLFIPIINMLIAYYAMYFGLCPYTTGVMLPWTTPVLLNGFLATNSWQGSAVQVVQLIVDGALWLPFILTIDKRMCKQESAEIATNALNIIIAATEAKKAAGEKVLAEQEKQKAKDDAKLSDSETKTKTKDKDKK